MKNDIYKTQSKPTKPDVYTREKKAVDQVAKVKVINQTHPKDIQKVLITNKEELLDVFKTAFSELKEIKILNPYEAPDVQKVQVENPPELVIPDVQKVTVENIADFPTPPKVQTVKVQNYPDPPIIKIPSRYNIDNMPIFPFGEGDIPGKADPTKYINVRLTNGKEFYNALKDFWVSAGKGSPNATGGGGGIVTSVSGTFNATIDNFPTIQSVFVTNPSSATITTTSGTPLDAVIRNLPTIQTVNVQNLPPINGIVTANQGGAPWLVQIQPGITTAVSGTLNVTSVSGMDHTNVDNFPTIQTVSVQNLPVLATTSGGGFHVTVDNFPNTFSVNVFSLPPITGSVTTLSGSKIDIQNFPTVQTVNVLNQPNQTSLSGMFHTTIDNFPTTFMVNVQNMPAITGSVTTISGSKVDIQNFPTKQTVIVENIVTVSGNALPGPIFGQVKVTVSGTAVQFPSNGLQNGVIITAHGDNLAAMVLGKVGVTYQLDGTGNGQELLPGASVSVAIPNTNLLYLNGQATDFITFVGS